jgi:tetratricopeptide (TPR) repeat protein
VSNWSNRFVSAAALALLAACGSAPRRAPPAAAQAVQVPVADTAPAAGTPSSVRAAANAPAAQEAPIPDRAAQQYAQALQLMKAGRATDAELEFKELSVAYPEYAGPELNLGLLYLRDSHLPEAEAAFKTALQRSPTNPIAGNELGIVERKLGKFAQAEAAYEQAITAEPNYAAAHLNLGVLYDLYLGEPQKALDQFERYISIAGENKQVAGWVVELRKRVGAPPPPTAKKEAA